MPASLLKSQFDILEIPEDAVVVSIQDDPNVIVQKISAFLETNPFYD